MKWAYFFHLAMGLFVYSNPKLLESASDTQATALTKWLFADNKFL
jgi:hypothetical protein